MTPTQIREEINKIIEKLPDEALGGLLAYLQQIEKSLAGKLPLAHNLRKILTEDRELFQRLAK